VVPSEMVDRGFTVVYNWLWPGESACNRTSAVNPVRVYLAICSEPGQDAPETLQCACRQSALQHL
jgi:hypothetical protein